MNKIFKIVVHSAVEIITNSSTVIYTYSDGSLSAVEELVNEMLKVFESDKKFNDLFNAGVFCDSDQYTDSEYFPAFGEYKSIGECEEESTDSTKLIDPEELNYNLPEYDLYQTKKSEFVESTIARIMAGEIDRPKWMVDIEEYESDDYYAPNTQLYLTVKDEKYSELSNKLLSFLTSQNHEATNV
jgi:hypothetical protein